jgi:hypothetical protein
LYVGHLIEKQSVRQIRHKITDVIDCQGQSILQKEFLPANVYVLNAQWRSMRHCSTPWCADPETRCQSGVTAVADRN